MLGYTDASAHWIAGCSSLHTDEMSKPETNPKFLKGKYGSGA